MKKMFFIPLFLINTAQAKQIILNIPDRDIAIVENDVVDAEQWIKEAWAGKLNNCKTRLINQEMNRSRRDMESIPAGDDAIINKALSRPDYKNRKQRDLIGK